MNQNTQSPAPAPAGAPLQPRRPWREWLLLTITVCLLGWAYYFSIPAEFRGTSTLPSGYYGGLTEAFLAGQFHLKIDTDPRLLALKNPYAGPQGANRPHDMSYYRGRFYLYYGAAPVILLYLPWRCLTGTYLGESMGTVLMVFGGVLLAVAWLVAARRRWFPTVSIGWLLLLILVIGFNPPLFTLATNNTFYAVPIACAFFCLMAAFSATNCALSAKQPGAAAGWLATASLFWGLAVGARPIYVLGLAALAAPAVWLWWIAGREVRWRWTGLRLLAAAVVPAAVIGVALMFYNYMRFDSPFEFGIRFSLASGDLRSVRLVGPEFIPKNISLYLFHRADFIRYFPFIMAAERPWGILPHLPFVALAALFPLSWINPRLRQRQWVLAGMMLLGAGAANFSLLCLFFGGEERYLPDFVPGLLLLAAVVAMAGLDAAQRTPRRFLYWITGSLVAALAAYALFTGMMLTLPRHDGAGNILWLERLLNTPAYWFETYAGTRHGPLELDLKFPRDRMGATEPLLTTGYDQQGRDNVAVRYLDETHVQFRAFHLGRGGPVSEPIRIDYQVPHRVRIAMGSLYPPRGHPVFSGWPPSQVGRIHRRLKIELDDQPVLQGNFPVYPSTPPGILVGRSGLSQDISGPAFTGRILAQRRTGIDLAAAAGFERSEGPVRLTLHLPPRSGDEGLPLIATGSRDRGDLLFVQLLENGLVRFGHDSFGAGAIVTAAVPFDSVRDQVVEVEMGSLYPPEKDQVSPFLRQRLRIVFNGESLIDTARPFNPSTSDEVEFGFNTIQASTAIEYFPGAIRQAQRIAARPAANMKQWGPLRLAVIFPDNPVPLSEPLLVTGHTGRADVLFVRYEPDGTLRFGHDHWGVGGSMSEPIRVNRGQSQLIEIWSGALLPPPDDSAWNGRDPHLAEQLRNRFEVRLNGKTVLAPGIAPYSNEAGEVALGSNPIGASTCESFFTGHFVLAERLPW